MARRRHLRIGATWVGIVGAVTLLSLWPESSNDQSSGSDWSAGHLPAYAVVTWASVALFRSRGAGERRAGVAGAATAVAIGAAMEGLQPLFGRSASLADVAWNIGGAVLGLAAWQALREYRKE